MPLDNEKLVSDIRYIMSESEAKELIKKIPDIPAADWYSESKKRNDYYNKLIESKDVEKIVAVIKAVWLSNEERKNSGKKGYISDENMLRKAEGILHEELSISLGVDEKEMKRVIVESIEK